MSSCEKSCGCGSVSAPAEAASAPSTELAKALQIFSSMYGPAIGAAVVLK